MSLRSDDEMSPTNMAHTLRDDIELSNKTPNNSLFTNDVRDNHRGNKGYAASSDGRGKRPELPLYKPGMGLRNKRPGHLLQEEEEWLLNPDGEETLKSRTNMSLCKNVEALRVSSESESFKEQLNAETIKSSKARRPDKPVYIPKQKQHGPQSNCSSSPIPGDVEESSMISGNGTNHSDSEFEGSHISTASERNTPNSARLPSRLNPQKSSNTSHSQRRKDNDKVKGVELDKQSSKAEPPRSRQSFENTISNGQCSRSQDNPDNTSFHNLNRLEQFDKRNVLTDKKPSTRKQGERGEKNEQNNKERCAKKGRGKGRRKSESKSEESRKETSSKPEPQNSSAKVTISSMNNNNNSNQSKINITQRKESGTAPMYFPKPNGYVSPFNEKNVVPSTTNNFSPLNEKKVKSPSLGTTSNSAINYVAVCDKPSPQVINNTYNSNLLSKPKSPVFPEKVPTLIYEPTRKVGDWCDQVEMAEQLSRTTVHTEQERRNSNHLDRPPVTVNKDTKLHRTARTLVRNDHTDRKSYHENVPPRFQKSNIEVKPYQPPVIEEKSPIDVKIGGILHLPLNSLTSSPVSELRNTPSPHPISRDRFNRTSPAPEVVPFVVPSKQLYEPNAPDNPVVCVSNYVIRPQLTVERTRSMQILHSDLGTQPYVPPVLPQTMPFMDPFGHCSNLSRPPCLYTNYNMGSSYSSQTPAASAPTLPVSYVTSFSDQLIHSENPVSKRIIKPIVEKNLTDAGLLERELNSYLSRGLENVDMKAFGQCRFKLQLRYENIILADPRFCADRNVENALWKAGFHNVIEAYRRLKEQQPQKEEEVNKSIINLVEEGMMFYDSLLEKQQETFGLNLGQFLDPEVVRPQYPDSVRLILFSAQKIYICLGDLARYREHATNTTNYGKARNWYMKAQQIAPKNGRPYNQLAILALCVRRKLDAVYFYMRSLAASNPFLSANESLLSLFDEARKKFEVLDKKRQEDRLSAKREHRSSSQRKIIMEDRVEIWTNLNYSRAPAAAASKEESLKDMSTVDLNKRFVLSFLHVHGKLFTKVGMEDFTETANQMLQEFRSLLQRTPYTYSSARLLQLLAINLFAIANTSFKDKAMGSCPQHRSPLQEHALQVSLAMMAVILEQSTHLFHEHLQSPTAFSSGQLVNDDLAQLLPTIKVWSDWMACQRSLWQPPPVYGQLKTGCKGDVWTLYADFLSVMRKVSTDCIPMVDKELAGHELVCLPEDNSLAGFVPLMAVPEKNCYALAPFDKEKARTCLRINRLCYFGEYLCGIQPAYLEWNVQKNCFVSLVATNSPTGSPGFSPHATAHNSSEEDSCSDEEGPILNGSDGGCSSEGEDSEIRQLRSRKETLRKTRSRQEQHHAQVQELLRAQRRLVVEVCPRIVVPDTNCFINHLAGIKSLMEAGLFQVYVPLIVINELDGLTRGSRDESPDVSSSSPLHRPSSSSFRGPSASPHAHHSRTAAQESRLAVDCLEQRFAVGDPKLRAVTSKGSLLDTISFRSEDVSDNKGTNDDLILKCCEHFCNDKAANYMPRDPDCPLRLQREVVLLTEDRNLRVKAMSINVPVKTVQQFLNWANIR